MATSAAKIQAETKEILARAALQLAQSQVMTTDEIRNYLFDLAKLPNKGVATRPKPMLNIIGGK